MAHHLAKTYSVVSYFMALIGGLFIGLSVAAFTEAGKGQMLAAGAIVLFYGLIGSFLALCLSFLLAYMTNKKVIVSMSIFYALAIVISFFYLRYTKAQRDAERSKQQQQFEPQNESTNPSSEVDTAFLIEGIKEEKTDGLNQTGLGMFTPNFYENDRLYFYGQITEGKSVMEHTPTDSVTFVQSQYGGFDIATAPPWLVPEHLKLDYDLLYFKVQSLGRDFIEITVNTQTNRTAFVDRFAGNILYWPEFILKVSSVEFPDPENHHIYVRPFDEAGQIMKSLYSFMQPIKVRQDWLLVNLVNDDYSVVGQGWIRWMRDGKLLITYNLLS